MQQHPTLKSHDYVFVRQYSIRSPYNGFREKASEKSETFHVEDSDLLTCAWNIFLILEFNIVMQDLKCVCGNMSVNESERQMKQKILLTDDIPPKYQSRSVVQYY